MPNSYEERLKAAASIIISKDATLTTEGSGNETATSFNCEEIGVTATLKPHQVDGVRWLIRRYLLGVNVILGDEMGLGKTLQAVTFLSYLKESRRLPGPFLVLCPLSVTDGWLSEIEKFAPKLRVLSYNGDKDRRRTLRRTMYEHIQRQTLSDVPSWPFDVLLTTYDIALIDQDFLSQFQWHYAIIDEAQRLKNPSSVLYGVLKDRYVMPRCLLLTGTPIQNNLSELWALMHFCMPSVFGTLEQFLRTFKGVGQVSAGHVSGETKEHLKTLKCILGALMLRRTKAKLIECGTLVLPPLTEITVMVPLVPLQKSVYTSILRKELPKLLVLASGTANVPSLRNIVIQLRKACSHPYLFPGIEPEPYEEGEHLVQASGKLLILDQLLQKLHKSGHRVLIFAQMTHTLDILQDYLELRHYTYERLDGSVRAEERFAAIRSFSGRSTSRNNNSEANDHDGAFVFLISTRAGGVGLNLIAADTVIFFEQDWNPQVDRQALQRAHRIGQMNHVLSINLVTGRSIEEVILRRAQRKLQLSHDVVGDDVSEHMDKELSGAEPGDLKSMIYGLRLFDPEESSKENLNEPKISELNALAEKVLSKRHGQKLDEDVGKSESQSINFNGEEFGMGRDDMSIGLDPGLDEASYRSWVEKFKETVEVTDTPSLEKESRSVSAEEKRLRLDAARKKAQEKKLAKWQTLGYESLAIADPVMPIASDTMSDHGAVNFVFGDCTRPSNVCPDEPTIVFSCVDDSGNWGRGGLFDALARLSSKVPEAYERAAEFGDLHLGDLHLIRKDDNSDEHGNTPQWVALAVVQTYNARRKVPRSDISISDLELCLSKASSAAVQNSASIHMPRIGYQDGDRAAWYSTERLLRKYASLFGVQIYVYYYRRSQTAD